MKKIVLPAFLSVFALLAFVPQAHAYRGNQCYQTYQMGGSLTVTYASPCPQPAPVTYYAPLPRNVYYYPAPSQRVVYYKPGHGPHGKWDRNHKHGHDDRGRHDHSRRDNDRHDGRRDGHRN